jgi:hypothetical protein
MLAHDRRILDVPLAERLQSRTSDLIASAKIMFPVITQSVRDARAQIHTGHRDIRTYLFGATVAGTATTTTPATATATSTARASASLPDNRQRSQGHEQRSPRSPQRSAGSFLVATAPLKAIGSNNTHVSN